MTFVRSAFVRLIKLLSVILIVSFLTFMLTKLLPGSPVNLILGPEASNPVARSVLEARLGLDEPLLVQYWNYLYGVLFEHDLGYSYLQDIPTTTYLAQRLPATIELMILAQFFSLMISVPVALWSAYKANSASDKLLTAGSFGLISLPAFALAPFLVYFFAIQLGWVPSGGYARITEEGLVENLRSVALPVLVLTTGLTAVYTRLLRSDLIATLQEDFVLMARSKGLTTRHILFRHALRPSSFSLLTVFGINFGTLIGGSIIVEVFFSIPGVGSLVTEQILKREYLVVQGVVLLIATVFVVVNFITDLLMPCSILVSEGQVSMTDLASTPGVHEDLAIPGAVLTSTDPTSRRRRRGTLGVAGWVSVVWLTFVVAGALLADVLPLKDPNTFDVLNPNQIPNQPVGTPGFILGTDANSWDIFSRLIYGGRVSLIVALGVLTIGMVIGGGIGLVAGFMRGRSETFLMAVVDIFLAFPALVLLIAIVAFLGSDLRNVVVGISLVSIPAFARISRATTLTFSRREFVLAAEAAGASKWRILVREVLPNVILPLMAFGLLVVGIAIVAEGSLAFLGLTSPDTISWGGMIDDARRGLQQEHIAGPALLPALWLFLTVLSVNFLGDRFRAAFDVKDAAL